ncbi:unnamed protein product [Durusdinium trenchii]|uniref:Uncharacterized protein n=1 Tax=Durusdinium trenchii TaxID=1381693 RepID=A0ABP0MWG5_9DINO
MESFEVVLSHRSIDALDKLDDIETWLVHPTMTRGRKKASDTLETNKKKPQPRLRGRKRKQTDDPQGDPQGADAADGHGVKRKGAIDPQEASKAPKVSDTLAALDEDLDENSYRRSAKGRKAISRKVQRLCYLDTEAFPNSPLFGLDGKCRMKHESAQCLTLQQIAEVCPQYSSIHSPTLYGKTVHKLLGGIERQLRDTPPQRGALLRLVKDIAEFHMSLKRSKGLQEIAREADNSGVSVIQLTPLVKVHEEYWYEEDEPRWTIRLLRWRFEQRISEEEMGEWQIASLEEKWFREKLYTKKR